ncbi:hypothetical protein Tco_1014242 [Tanacetum coccineum]
MANLLKSLVSHPGHLTVAADYFFNNDLEYLKSSDLERMYTTSITKTKAARYEIEGIEDMVPTLWSPTKVGSQLNKFFKHNVYSTKKILGVKSVSVKKLHGYGHLEEIVVKRANRQFYKFKEGDFVDLYLNDIEDMLFLAVQHKLFHLIDNDIVQHKLFHLFTFPEIEFKELYTPSHKLPGEMPRRKWTATDRKRSELMVELIDKQIRERRIIRNLERLVGARELEMDYKLMTRTV